MFISLFQFCPSATNHTIGTHSLASGFDFVELNWTQPKFLPERYQLMCVCVTKPSRTPSPYSNDSVLTIKQNLSSDTTSIRVSHLRPSSKCMLFLLAVHNPASIDSGIMVTGATSDVDTSKKNVCKADFIVTFCNCLYVLGTIFIRTHNQH